MDRKKLRHGMEVEVDEAVYIWFKQLREKGTPITGRMVQLKALYFSNILNPGSDFTASAGWLWRFSNRHGIRQLYLSGEKLSADHQAAEKFVKDLDNVVNKENLTWDQIFNADESGLYFRMLPNKTLVASYEKSAHGRKKQLERVTFTVCANATGTIQLPLHVIGKSKKPRCFRQIREEDLPVVYANSRSAWMTEAIFKSWFHDTFVPFVREKRDSMGCEPKALLIVDNCSAHPQPEELISADGLIRTMFLPPNVTALIQPMDQGIIASLKGHYRRILCERIVECYASEMDLRDFLKNLNLLQAVKILSEAWNMVSKSTLAHGWNKIRAKEEDNEAEDDDGVDEVVNLLNTCNTEDTANSDDVEQWLKSDEGMQGHEHMDDETIVGYVTSVDQAVNELDEDSEEEAVDHVSHAQAVRLAEELIKYLKQQADCSPQQLQDMQFLKESAAKKRNSVLKQSKIDQFFK